MSTSSLHAALHACEVGAQWQLALHLGTAHAMAALVTGALRVTWSFDGVWLSEFLVMISIHSVYVYVSSFSIYYYFIFGDFVYSYSVFFFFCEFINGSFNFSFLT